MVIKILTASINNERIIFPVPSVASANISEFLLRFRLERCVRLVQLRSYLLVPTRHYEVLGGLLGEGSEDLFVLLGAEDKTRAAVVEEVFQHIRRVKRGKRYSWNSKIWIKYGNAENLE